MNLSQAAGWNQTAEDWRRCLEMQPEGCFGMDSDGVLAATATAMCYGRELAWIGMVLTLPEYRGRGFARGLMRHALEYVDRAEVACVKLDATNMGAPLYRKLGFVDECPIERWGRDARIAPVAADVAAFELDVALDRDAFGVRREALLRRLASSEAASIPGEGYAMGRPGRVASYFGPCVARSPHFARRLAAWHLARHPGEPVFWDLMPDNLEAESLARELGFTPLRRLMRMQRGSPIHANSALVYGIAGFEWG